MQEAWSIRSKIEALAWERPDTERESGASSLRLAVELIVMNNAEAHVWLGARGLRSRHSKLALWRFAGYSGGREVQLRDRAANSLCCAMR